MAGDKYRIKSFLCILLVKEIKMINLLFSYSLNCLIQNKNVYKPFLLRHATYNTWKY